MDTTIPNLDDVESMLVEIKGKLKLTEESPFTRDYLTCLICLEVVVDGWVSSICKKIMCYTCITKFLYETQFSKKCPQLCDSNGIHHVYMKPNIYIQKILVCGTFVCAKCNENCVGSQALQIHKELRHKKELDIQQNACPTCSQTLAKGHDCIPVMA